MQKSIILIAIVLLFGSCKTTKKASEEPVQNHKNMVEQSNDSNKEQRMDRHYQMQQRGVDFFGSGNEPFWAVEIDFSKHIRLTSLFGIDSLIVPISDPIIVMDAPMINYKGITDEGEVLVSIEQIECIDNMSGIKRPYVVRVSGKLNKDNSFFEFKGCGEYYGNVRLHDIWALESINGENVKALKFKDHPYMELHLNNGKVYGHLGCNSFTTNFFFGRDEIFFSQIASTKMACPALDLETKFSKALSNRRLKYRLEDLSLILENNVDTLIFKKVD